MRGDETLAADEARRIGQYEAVKGEVREKVHSEISREADRTTPAERASAEAFAGDLKQKAVHEVADTEIELERGKILARVSQLIDYAFYLVYGIIGLEIALEGLGARESAGFKAFVDTLSAPLLAPFRGLLADPGLGPFQFMLSYVFALIVYILLHLAVNGLLRLAVHKKTMV